MLVNKYITIFKDHQEVVKPCHDTHKETLNILHATHFYSPDWKQYGGKMVVIVDYILYILIVHSGNTMEDKTSVFVRKAQSTMEEALCQQRKEMYDQFVKLMRCFTSPYNSIARMLILELRYHLEEGFH